MNVRVPVALALMVFSASMALAQTVSVRVNVNLRTEQSMQDPPIRVLTPSEPPLRLLEPWVLDGYYHVITSAGEEGYVWSAAVTVSVTPTGAVPTPPQAAPPPPGVPGSPSMIGCGDHLWAHVYHPTRLTVVQDCVTVTGVMVDATANQPVHQPDGVRHEADGDTHGWLKIDPQFSNMINAGNTSAENGNLVFEIVCHFPVTQLDAKPACAGFADHTKLPPINSHVAITGSWVQEKNHAQWFEIHPVSSIKVQ
jgi:hypothetical protein